MSILLLILGTTPSNFSLSVWYWLWICHMWIAIRSFYPYFHEFLFHERTFYFTSLSLHLFVHVFFAFDTVHVAY